MTALKKIYNTYKLYIFPMIVGVSCLVLIVFIIYPQLSGLLANFQTENQIKSKFVAMEVKAQTLETIDAQDLTNKLDLALNFYPQDYDFATVVGILQNVVGKYGFSIVSLNLSRSSQQSKSADSSFNVKLEIAGPKTSLGTLISAVENSPRVMKVNAIEISGIKLNENASVVLSIGVYFKPMPNTFGGVDSPLPALTDKEEAILATLAKVNPASTTQFTSVSRGKPNPFE